MSLPPDVVEGITKQIDAIDGLLSAGIALLESRRTDRDNVSNEIIAMEAERDVHMRSINDLMTAIGRKPVFTFEGPVLTSGEPAPAEPVTNPTVVEVGDEPVQPIELPEVTDAAPSDDPVGEDDDPVDIDDLDFAMQGPGGTPLTLGLEGGQPDPSSMPGADPAEPPVKLPEPRKRRVYPTVEKRCGSCGHTEVVAANRKKCTKCKTGRIKPLPASERPPAPCTAVKRGQGAEIAERGKKAGNSKPGTGRYKNPNAPTKAPEAACSDFTKPGPSRVKKKCCNCRKIVYALESVDACPYCDKARVLGAL